MIEKLIQKENCCFGKTWDFNFFGSSYADHITTWSNKSWVWCKPIPSRQGWISDIAEISHLTWGNNGGISTLANTEKEIQNSNICSIIV